MVGRDIGSSLPRFFPDVERFPRSAGGRICDRVRIALHFRRKSSMDSLQNHSALELAALIRRRVLSPLEVVSSYIARAERVNPALNAIVAERFEAAHYEARHATEKLVRAR